MNYKNLIFINLYIRNSFILTCLCITCYREYRYYEKPYYHAKSYIGRIILRSIFINKNCFLTKCSIDIYTSLIMHYCPMKYIESAVSRAECSYDGLLDVLENPSKNS